jgi:glucokinase
MSATPRYLGLDLGGTNIKVAVLEATPGEAQPFAVVGTDSGRTYAELGPARVVDRLTEVGRAALDRWGPVVAGAVGVPGLFDSDAGTIELFPNLPGPWHGQPVRDPLSDRLGVPFAIINDAKAFTLAETRLGAARGCSTVVSFVLGTGIGGGLVVDGRLRFGPHGRAGEVGHQVVIPDGPLCGCGNRGCLEAVATAAPFALMAGRASPAEAVAAAAAGDVRALRAVEVVADYLGLAIGNVVTLLVPERVVIGGGIAEAGELLLGPIREAVTRHQKIVPPAWFQVVSAELGPLAGAVGAALWAAEAVGYAA